MASAIEKPETEAPGGSANGVQQDLERPTAEQIYEQVTENARSELDRGSLELAVSGVVGGVGMGLTALGSALVLGTLGEGNGAKFISNIFYPLGFIAVILGRAQLFTENTLYPVALVLTEKRHYLNTLRLWAVVLPANLLGGFLFALLAVCSSGLKPGYVTALATLGVEASAHPMMQIFWSAVFGGWIIAMVAWLVSASHSISGSVMLIWLLTFVVGLGNFAHSIATSIEVLSAVLSHRVPAMEFFRWLLPAVAGNVCGGVLMVTLLEYGQTKATK